MTRWIPIAAIAWLLFPSQGRAAFATCEDAHNYGENSGRLYASQVFGRMACDELLLSTIENALMRMLSTQVLQTTDTDTEKLCFYDGLWDGLVGQTSLEYAACGGLDVFACVDRTALAGYAGSLLRAIATTFPGQDDLDDSSMTLVFDLDEDILSGVLLCAPISTTSCATIVRDRAGPRVIGRLNALVGNIARTVCQ